MHALQLRPFFRLAPDAALPVAFCLAVAFAGMRAIAMLGPVAYRPLFLLHCVLLALVPWILLSRQDRAQVGLKPSTRPREYPLALLYGALASLVCFAIGYSLFGTSQDNWFVSVGDSFRAQPTDGLGLLQLSLMFTLPGMLFSPIGEEIFFRGYFQRCLETRFSERNSTLIEASWFGGVHLVHHGIVLTAAGNGFRAMSGALWFLLMVALSCMFAWLRKRHDSIRPAILAHSAFNATMTTLIFSYLWQ
jgi:membrane protease YdiL (CAAX protease family)